MVVKIGGQRRYLWRAVDNERKVLDMPIQKRLDKAADKEAYAGPVVVGGATFVPIAGHRQSNPILKLFSGRTIETTLAPVEATAFMLPYRIVVESMLANLVVQATEFKLPLGKE